MRNFSGAGYFRPCSPLSVAAVGARDAHPKVLFVIDVFKKRKLRIYLANCCVYPSVFPWLTHYI